MTIEAGVRLTTTEGKDVFQLATVDVKLVDFSQIPNSRRLPPITAQDLQNQSALSH